jgi:hypothetical protein
MSTDADVVAMVTSKAAKLHILKYKETQFYSDLPSINRWASVLVERTR